MTDAAVKNDAGQIRLRDKRKPGHCWQDNELYDCFQPVIGPLAVSVYVRITRECYGATLKVSLRELATLTGISKSAVARAMAVLELVGMVVAKRGSANRAPEYDLADLKELAIAFDAVFDAKRSSYVLPKEKREQLRADVAALEQRLHGRRAPMGDTDGEDVGDTTVPRRGHPCPPNPEKKLGQQISKKKRIQVKNKTPLPPSHASGESCKHESEAGDGKNGKRADGVLCAEPGGDEGVDRAAAVGRRSGDCERIRADGVRGGDRAQAGGSGGSVVDAELTAAIERVARGMGIGDRRGRIAIRDALRVACDEPPDAMAELMLKNWAAYSNDAGNGLLRYTVKPVNFIRQGIWANPATWPYDQARLERMREANVGRYR